MTSCPAVRTAMGLLWSIDVADAILAGKWSYKSVVVAGIMVIRDVSTRSDHLIPTRWWYLLRAS
jgi:hypothetical protein